MTELVRVADSCKHEQIPIMRVNQFRLIRSDIGSDIIGKARGDIRTNQMRASWIESLESGETTGSPKGFDTADLKEAKALLDELSA
jgi:hypothetical protein